MEVFNHSAQYYDLLYTTKNYETEVNYVDTLIKKHSPATKTILDLGCGTGTHDFFLAKKKYTVTGIDLSSKMVAIAQQKKETQGVENIDFAQGNLVSLNLDKEFDTVVSLFHVMNYLTSNKDMEAGFATATRHIKSGGIFIFDCWYGPAVLTDLPKTGVKRLENELIKVTRLVEPVLHVNANTVDVNYEIIVEEKSSAHFATIKETHSVRYFFKPEIELLFEKFGLEMLAAEEWLTGKEIGSNTFGVCFVAKKK